MPEVLGAAGQLTGPSVPLAVLSTGSERAVDALRRSLSRARRFAFYVLLADGPARSEIVRRLRVWSGNAGIPRMLFLPPEGGDLASNLTDLLGRKTESPVTAAVITDADALLRSDAGRSTVELLNVARDRLARIVDGPLLLVVSPDQEPDLARLAPDLFDVRAGTHAFESTLVEPETTAPAWSPPRLGQRGRAAPLDGLHLRAAQLRRLEAEHVPAGAVADGWIALAEDYLSLGELAEVMAAAGEARRVGLGSGYAEAAVKAYVAEGMALRLLGRAADAEEMLRKALAICDDERFSAGRAIVLTELAPVLLDAGNARGAEHAARAAADYFKASRDASRRLRALDRLAETWSAQGRLADAARLLLKDVIPGLGRLDDRHGQATAWHHVALVRERQGLYDVALHIAKQALSLYEQVGDAAGRANTMRLIADLMARKGEHEEALRLHLEEVLPVIERIGLGGEGARVLELLRIARALQKLGRLDEAVRVLRSQVMESAVRLRRVDVLLEAGRLAGALLAEADRIDDALDLWRTEILPAMESMDDPLGRAAAHLAIAELLARRGQISDAATLVRAEVMPALASESGTRARRAEVRAEAVALLHAAGGPDRELGHQILQQALDEATAAALPESIATIEGLLTAGIRAKETESPSRPARRRGSTKRMRKRR